MYAIKIQRLAQPDDLRIERKDFINEEFIGVKPVMAEVAFDLLIKGTRHQHRTYASKAAQFGQAGLQRIMTVYPRDTFERDEIKRLRRKTKVWQIERQAGLRRSTSIAALEVGH